MPPLLPHLLRLLLVLFSVSIVNGVVLNQDMSVDLGLFPLKSIDQPFGFLPGGQYTLRLTDFVRLSLWRDHVSRWTCQTEHFLNFVLHFLLSFFSFLFSFFSFFVLHFFSFLLFFSSFLFFLSFRFISLSLSNLLQGLKDIGLLKWLWEDLGSFCFAFTGVEMTKLTPTLFSLEETRDRTTEWN